MVLWCYGAMLSSFVVSLSQQTVMNNHTDCRDKGGFSMKRKHYDIEIRATISWITSGTYIGARVHNIRREGEYPTLPIPCSNALP